MNPHERALHNTALVALNTIASGSPAMTREVMLRVAGQALADIRLGIVGKMQTGAIRDKGSRQLRLDAGLCTRCIKTRENLDLTCCNRCLGIRARCSKRHYDLKKKAQSP